MQIVKTYKISHNYISHERWLLKSSIKNTKKTGKQRWYLRHVTVTLRAVKMAGEHERKPLLSDDEGGIEYDEYSINKSKTKHVSILT